MEQLTIDELFKLLSQWEEEEITTMDVYERIYGRVDVENKLHFYLKGIPNTKSGSPIKDSTLYLLKDGYGITLNETEITDLYKVLKSAFRD